MDEADPDDPRLLPPRSADLPLPDHLARDDCAAIVRLLVEALANDAPLATRRTAVFAGLAKLIDADIWCWIQSRSDPQSGQLAPLGVLEGGWRDDAERADFMNANCDPRIVGPLLPIVLGDALRSTLFDEIFVPGRDDEIARFWHTSTGMGDCILCTYPLGERTWSNIGFHRRVGRPAFTSRERGIAHVLLSQIDVLHRPGQEVPANDDALFALAPRERQTLIHLLSGDGVKQIAQQMRLSTHTVNGYIQKIYRTIGVTSRAELMRKFMSGGAR